MSRVIHRTEVQVNRQDVFNVCQVAFRDLFPQREFRDLESIDTSDPSFVTFIYTEQIAATPPPPGPIIAPPGGAPENEGPDRFTTPRDGSPGPVFPAIAFIAGLLSSAASYYFFIH